MLNPDRARIVVLDAFGTLVRRMAPTDAYARLWAHRDMGRPGLFAEDAMRTDRSFMSLARHWGVPLDKARAWETDVRADTILVMPFAEARPALAHLRQTGRHVIVCSNLAQPYADAIQRHFSGLINAWVWSFETGHLKPEPAMYETVMKLTGRPAGDHWMVGDRLKEDVLAPQALGWQAAQVVRPGQPGPVAEHAWSSLSPFLDWATLPPLAG